MKITYFLDVTSSWCYWAEPAWLALKQRYDDRVEFNWKIAQMPAAAYPQSRAQCDWYYRRSGTIMRSPFKLSSGWFEPAIKQYVVPNLVAEAAKDFDVTDDLVRLAIAHAGVREGKKIGRWDVAVEVAASAANLDPVALLKRAKSAEVKARVRASSQEFDSLQINQRPGFLLDSEIGDRAVFSGLATMEPIAAALDAMLADAAAYVSYTAQHGGTPPK
jgi:predicted DsbA family dithiol-disulfide isomerase